MTIIGDVMREEAREVRDGIVRALAKLSLIMVLGVLGALFVGGSAAQGQAPADSTPVVQHSQPAEEGVSDQASPLGLVIVAFVVVGGMGVLLVGALKPRRGDDRDLAELLRD